MKKLMFLFLLAAGITAGAADISQAVKDLNAAIEQLIAPLRNETTQARLNFKDIQTNEVRALVLAAEALYKKTGPANTVEIRIDNLDYTYGDGTTPTTHIKGFLGADLTKLFSQQQLNQMIPELESLVKSIADSFTRDYGQAATVLFEVVSKDKDEAGNFTALKARLKVNIDLALLPQSVKPEDVMIQVVSAELSADLKVGVNIDATIVSNPNYKGFGKDQMGLKEGLDKLLSKDAQELADIQKFFTDLDTSATRIVNGQGF